MSSRKQRVFNELIDEVRRSQAATDRFDQAVADAVGLNRTDIRCVDVLDREGPLTAGRLAQAMGLTSGAVTTLVDRLERAGHARRVRDERDRRRVLVELTPEARGLAASFYAPHAEAAQQIYRRYTEDQIAMLLEFVRGSREFNERQAELLEERNRARGRG